MTPRRWTDDFTTVNTGRCWKEGSVSLQMADTEAEAPKKPRDRFFKNGHQMQGVVIHFSKGLKMALISVY